MAGINLLVTGHLALSVGVSSHDKHFVDPYSGW